MTTYLAQFAYCYSEIHQLCIVEVENGKIVNIELLDQPSERANTIFLNGILTGPMVGKTMERMRISPFSTIDYLLELLQETTQELKIGDDANLLLWDFVPASSGILNKKEL